MPVEHKTTVVAGQRVRIKVSEADDYLQPLRKWGQEGRLGTVERLDERWGNAWVMFDCKRKPVRPLDYRVAVRLKDLEVVA